MNRFHVHLNVADLPASVAFYSRLFGTAPTVAKPDYGVIFSDGVEQDFLEFNAGAQATVGLAARTGQLVQ